MAPNIPIHQTIGFRIFLAILLFSIIVTGLTTSLSIRRQYITNKQQIISHMEHVKKSILPSLSNNVWVGDRIQINLILDGITHLPDIDHAILQTRDKVLIAQAGALYSENNITRTFPLIYSYNWQEIDLGTITISASYDKIFAELRQKTYYALLEDGIKILFAGVFIFLIFHLLVTRHLKTMGDHVRNLDILNSKPLTLTRSGFKAGRIDELDDVVNAINEMHSNLAGAYLEIEQINIMLQEDIGKRQEAENKAVAAMEDWERTFNTFDDIVTIMDNTLVIQRVNKAACRMFGAEPEDLIGRHCYELFRGESKPCEKCPGIPAIYFSKSQVAEIEHKHLNKIFLISASPILDDSGELTGIVHTAKDITEHKLLEKQYIQAMKMESIGRLTGGIAHDFNNLLTAILGYCELAIGNTQDNTEMRRYLEVILNSAERAATLTRQLLAFSRKQPIMKKVVNLGILVNNMKMMLQRLIQENISLSIDCPISEMNIEADPGQVEQILMNLCVNARDAMPTGGTITIQTALFTADEDFAAWNEGLQPGAYVILQVIDTGMGMTREIQNKIFEPFFTTKDLGHGTGLGLATVYGIVKQHNGYISVESTPGRGTTFTVFFPISLADTPVAEDKKEEFFVPGKETILVVEDDPTIRTLIADSLQPKGFNVLGASGGSEAMDLARKYKGEIDVLLIDVIMPDMNGPEVAEQLRLIRPEAKTLFMSGYTDDIIEQYGILHPDVQFIQKPLIFKLLMSKIQEIMLQKNPIN
ncbi:MAG: response regulator [Proteobacteria bacterium]|nr:response regulator [Pseudomonadota bacterium]MBU1709379.1 response regulator [Pseudomonadota bacterium]